MLSWLDRKKLYHFSKMVEIKMQNGIKGGGSKATFLGGSVLSFGHRRCPLMIGETFGEVPGPRRPTVSEPRPAQK